MFKGIKSKIRSKTASKIYTSSISMFSLIKGNLEEGRFLDEDKLTMETTRLSFIRMKDNLSKIYRNDLKKRNDEAEAYDSLTAYCDKILESYVSSDSKQAIEYLEKIIEVNRLLLIQSSMM